MTGLQPSSPSVYAAIARKYSCGRLLAKRLDTEPDHRPVEELTDEELTRIIRDAQQTLGEFGTVIGEVEQ